MYDKSVDQELSPTLETRLIQKANYAVFNEQCPGGFPTALLDLSSKESSKLPVVFQKKAWHCSCWKPKGETSHEGQAKRLAGHAGPHGSESTRGSGPTARLRRRPAH